MAVFVNLESKVRLDALRMIMKVHDNILKDVSADAALTQGVKNIVTGYHRNKRDMAIDEMKKIISIPSEIAVLLDVKTPLIINQHPIQ
jgi:hypothetical protein